MGEKKSGPGEKRNGGVSKKKDLRGFFGIDRPSGVGSHVSKKIFEIYKGIYMGITLSYAVDLNGGKSSRI